MIFLLALAGLAVVPIAPWLGGGMIALAAYLSHWFWDGASEWLEITFFLLGAASVLGAFVGLV